MPETRTTELPDGRKLAWTEFGDEGGVPVINCHGGLTSRLDVGRCDAVARTSGIRLISPDRPGIGRSERRRGRTLLDWPSDVAALADEIGLTRFAVMGWSAGGAYAAACAYALPSRVSAAALVTSVIPRDWEGMAEDVNRMDRTFMGLSEHVPIVNTLVFGAMGAVARLSPDAFRRMSAVNLDASSRAVVLATPAAEFSEPIAEGTRDPAGVEDDYRILDSPWGFDPAAITAPVHIWQGTTDRLVPFGWGKRLAEHLANAQFTACAGEGHFLPLDRYAEIFASLAAH